MSLGLPLYVVDCDITLRYDKPVTPADKTDMTEAHRERQCEAHPDGGPRQGLSRANHMRRAIEYAKIQRQHRQYEGNEADPEPDIGGDHHRIYNAVRRTASSVNAAFVPLSRMLELDSLHGRVRRALSLALFLLPSTSTHAMPQSPAPAPVSALAIVNARVWTGDARRPWADAVLVRGERIELVGSSAEVKKRAGTAVRTIDARGMMVTPGFIDAHVHFLDGGFALMHAPSAESIKTATPTKKQRRPRVNDGYPQRRFRKCLHLPARSRSRSS